MRGFTNLSVEHTVTAIAERKLRVLLVPDSIHWITGTIARSILDHNAWMSGTIVSGGVLDIVARENPNLFAAFDVVHFLCPYASKRWLPLLRDRVACVTSHHHVTDWDAQRHNLNGDAIVVGSTQWATDAIERGASPDRVFRVPYGVDSSQFMPGTSESRAIVRGELGIPLEDIVVGFFAKRGSNELDRKGTDVFADAIQQLSRDLSNLAVLIVGPGWHEFISKLEAKGVKCVWLPFVRDSTEMAQMYHALDFYWVTARVEGGPVTLLEAMSCGVCCITTPVGLARDIVIDELNGALVPLNDAPAVASRTLALVGEPVTRFAMGQEARHTILTTMDARITARGVRDVYASAIAHFDHRVRASGFRRAALAPHTAASISQELENKLAILEQLLWAEALLLHHQRVLALHTICRTWLQNPTSSLPPRYLFRNLLPKYLVRALLAMKPAADRV